MILPPPQQPFEWRETPAGPALVCTPLESIATHLFTSRAWQLGQAPGSVASPWDEIADAIAIEPEALVRLRQVHGHTVVVAGREVVEAASPQEGDVAIARDERQAIAIQVADCVPLLIADRRLGVVAAAHAGWRGLAQSVPRVTVEALGRHYGSLPVDLVVAIGPSVGSCCYEVGSDVRQAFATGGFSRAVSDEWFGIRPSPSVTNPSMPGLPGRPRAGHEYFDGWSCAHAQLTDAGVPAEQIFIAGLCTASHPEVLCSYRRDGTQAGRLAAVIRPLKRSA